MGSTRYDDDIITSRLSYAASTGTSMFSHTDAIASGATSAKAHDLLDPKKLNSVDKNVRESFDSDIAPNSRAIAVMFDVTGSMGSVPKLFITKMATLMAALVKKDFVKDPHILFGAIGDASTDKVPLQVGQFEGGNEMDDALANVYIEGNGGGQSPPKESYELAMYYLARHTDIDCFKKRGEKGYVFLLGDERPYPKVKKSEVKEFIGDFIEADISVEDIIKELQEKFHVFWIMPGQTSNRNSPIIVDYVRGLFGQNFILLPQPEDVCELIVSTIGVTEGYDLHDVSSALKDVGADKKSVARSANALVAYAASVNHVAKATVVAGSLPDDDSSDVIEKI